LAENKVAILHPEKASPTALLAQVAADETVDGVIILVRRDDSWSSCWSGKINYGSLSMATLKLQHDIMHQIHGGQCQWGTVGAEDDAS
jgi:hypothetical protein